MVPNKLFVVLIGILLDVHCLEFLKKEFQKPNLQVKTESGKVQGTRLQSKSLKRGYYYAFMGIPYAQPPVGDLRFRSPKWVRNWPGVLDGSKQGSACVEVVLRISTGTSIVTGEEDCLFLNVFTKTNPATVKQFKPVMVFIHGGGYIQGSSDVKIYGPDLLVAKDVLVVTLNYRLGVFGFLSTEDLASPGNYGLKDQNLALRWIQRNIKYFGGDPDNVMIFGHSAGSISAHLHMLSPKSRGLFHKVLLESGSALCLWGSQRKPRNMAYLLGVANGITHPRDSYELVEKLREINLEELKKTLLGVALTGTSQSLFTGLPYAPTLEEDHEEAFLTRNNWYEMLETGNFSHVPVVMGMNSNESLFFLQEAMIAQPLLVLFDLDNSLITPPSMNISNKETSTIVGRMIRDHFLGENNRMSTVDIMELMNYLSQDNFLRPLWKTAELMNRYIPLYFYYFKYESDLGRYGLPSGREYPGIRGVSHEEEVHFIFNKLKDYSKNRTDYVVREWMLTLWTNFAKYSNPTPSVGRGNSALGNIVWPRFSSNASSRTNFLDIGDKLEVRHTPVNYDNILWYEELFQKYGNPPFHNY
uniref:Carboxylic ester hydrolase n=1 Tax=Coccinella septempunctata TaxID=41139 RepID=A0A218KG17_COCSE|nr:juvenile hormone esterase [Coccinella septempunctata]